MCHAILPSETVAIARAGGLTASWTTQTKRDAFHSNRQRLGTIIPIPNIGPRGKRRRLTWGLTTLVLAALLAGTLLAVGAPRAWRLAVFPLLYSAGLGVFQARAKT